MTSKKQIKPELLAPAGTVSVFESAVDAGADAIYIGAPALNARALSRDFTLAEISAMISFARSRGVKLYLATNSLLKESEIPQAIGMLAVLEELQPDGLIIQDLGLYHLCRKYFPSLRLHASTLLGAHNSLAVRQFKKMGFKRVVLARELTVSEIGSIAGKADVELEVFIHGARCLSYSGLCLFSSYLGGKSGLRGRCVQPCRRRYHWQHKRDKPGYFFSMNDLCGIDLIYRLQKAGVSSFKIEGRLRSAHYVSSVVKAYRMVIDGEPGDKKILREAKELLEQAMGRKTSRGYFDSPNPGNLISPYHSGNIGMYMGRAARGSGNGKINLILKQPLQVGDRLRLHQEQTGERIAFNLQNMRIKNHRTARAAKGERVVLEVPASTAVGDSLFKVDSRSSRDAEKRKPGLAVERFHPVAKKAEARTKQKVSEILKKLASGRDWGGKKTPRNMRRTKGRQFNSPSLYIKIADLQALKTRLPLMPELLLVELNQKTYGEYLRQRKTVRKYQHKLVWCLPPVILEAEVEFFSSAVEELMKNNFRSWQIGHIGQQLLFAGKRPSNLIGDYTLNILNSQGLHVLHNLKLQRVQTAIEIDRGCLHDLLVSRSAFPGRVDIGMTVYGRPPLFTARAAASHFEYDQPLISPKGETFVLHKSSNSTVALAENPFSLLPMLHELAGMGVNYAVIDLSHHKAGKKENEEIRRELSGRRSRHRLSTFNYNSSLL